MFNICIKREGGSIMGWNPVVDQQGWQHLSRRTQISEYHHFLDYSTTIHYVLEPLGYLQASAYVQVS